MRLLGFLLVVWCLGLTACGPEFDEPTARCAQSCAGCCSGDRCFDGTGDEACGAGGSICDGCGGFETCTWHAEGVRTCFFDRNERWLIEPVAAEVSEFNPTDGEDWDVDGSPPDVVVELFCPNGGRDIETRTTEDESYFPEWTDGGCTTTLGELSRARITIHVIDADLTFDDIIFMGSHSVGAEDLAAGSFFIPFPDQEGGLEVWLTRVP